MTKNKRDLESSLNEMLESEVFILTPEDGMIEEPIRSYKDLYNGLKIAVPTLLGYVEATVIKKRDQLYWESYNAFGLLRFADDKCCWISGGMINKSLNKQQPRGAYNTTTDGKFKLPVIS